MAIAFAFVGGIFATLAALMAWHWRMLVRASRNPRLSRGDPGHVPIFTFSLAGVAVMLLSYAVT